MLTMPNDIRLEQIVESMDHVDLGDDAQNQSDAGQRAKKLRLQHRLKD